MPKLKKQEPFKVFISHSWQRAKQEVSLRKMIDTYLAHENIEYLQLTEESPIYSQNTSYIKRKIRERISCCDVFICLTSMYSHHREWIQWEIKMANSLGIPIIGVSPRRQQKRARIVVDNAQTLVGWNGPNLCRKIQEYAICGL